VTRTSFYPHILPVLCRHADKVRVMLGCLHFMQIISSAC